MKAREIDPPTRRPTFGPVQWDVVAGWAVALFVVVAGWVALGAIVGTLWVAAP